MNKGLSTILINGAPAENDNKDFYPFYVIKNKNISRCSSLASLRQRRPFRVVKRLVRKNGKSAIKAKSTTLRSFRFILDLSNTLLEGHWAWIFLVLFAAFLATWLMFAGFWMIVARENVEDNNNGTCVVGVQGFAGFFLFSVETQSSIGYGGRYLTDECPEAVLTLCSQIVVGVCICGSLLCIVYLKMVGPPPHHRNVIGCFSRKAVICQRDGALQLVIRVRDPCALHECGTNIAAYLAQRRGGELRMRALKLTPATPLLLWPVEVTHRLDEKSPLWDLSAEDLLISRFEIIVALEGSSLTTSYMSRTTTSYLSKEILWGYKFKPCTTYDRHLGKYVVNHKLFNQTEEIDTPLCSSHHLREVFEDILSITNSSASHRDSSSTYTNPSSVVSPLMSRFGPINESDEVVADCSMRLEESNVPNNTFLSVPKHDDDSSHCTEDDYTFMDISVEDLTKRPRKSSSFVGDTARSLLNSLQSFVSEDNRKSDSKKYNETSF